MKRLLAAVLAVWALHPALANEAHHKDGAAKTPFSEGEVRRVDKVAKKLTIRHGPLANLDMPAMTMVFQVRDAAVLDKVKPGDKIRFVAEKVDGAYVATKVEPAR